MRVTVCAAAMMWLACARVEACQLSGVPEAPPAAKVAPETEDLLRSAAGVVPELQAEVILRVIAAGAVRDRERQVELIESAHQAAGRAQYRVPQRYAAAVQSPTRALFRTTSFRLGLDELSLRMRAVRSLLRLDRSKARELFAADYPTLSRAECGDPAIADVSAYFDAAHEVLQKAFSEQERSEELHLELARSIMSRTTSPAELPHIARLIAGPSYTQQQRTDLAAAFVNLLKRVTGDDRTFSATVEDLDSAIRKTLLRSFPDQSGTSILVLKAYREYLVRQFTGARCSDLVAAGSPQATLEARLRGSAFAEEGGFEPSEFRPANSASGPKTDRAFSHYAEFLGPGQKLFDDAEEDFGTATWQVRFDEFLEAIHALKVAPGQSESNLWIEKQSVLSELMLVAPPGRARERLMESLVLQLANSPLQKESWIEWYDRVQTTHGHVRSEEREALLNAFASSGNPELAVIAAAERTFPSGGESVAVRP